MGFLEGCDCPSAPCINPPLSRTDNYGGERWQRKFNSPLRLVEDFPRQFPLLEGLRTACLASTENKKANMLTPGTLKTVSGFWLIKNKCDPEIQRHEIEEKTTQTATTIILCGFACEPHMKQRYSLLMSVLLFQSTEGKEMTGLFVSPDEIFRGMRVKVSDYLT